MHACGGDVIYIHAKISSLLSFTQVRMCECDIIFWKQFSGIILKGAFHQVHANIRIDKPEVDAHHHSGAYIEIESGVDDIYNKIQVGWIVSETFRIKHSFNPPKTRENPK